MGPISQCFKQIEVSKRYTVQRKTSKLNEQKVYKREKSSVSLIARENQTVALFYPLGYKKTSLPKQSKNLSSHPLWVGYGERSTRAALEGSLAAPIEIQRYGHPWPRKPTSGLRPRETLTSDDMEHRVTVTATLGRQGTCLSLKGTSFPLSSWYSVLMGKWKHRAVKIFD